MRSSGGSTLETVGVISAKRKSKRCRNKNWRPFDGRKSLAEIAVEKALGAFDRVVLSIDFDPVKLPGRLPERVRVVQRPLVFPDSSVSVVLHALHATKTKDDDIYCLTQPTSPLTYCHTLRKVVAAAETYNVKAVTVNPAFKPNGCAYAGRFVDLRNHPDFFEPECVVIRCNWRESVDIDFEHDFQIARAVMGGTSLYVEGGREGV